MNFLKRWIFITLLLFLILAPVSPMRAQAQTPEPTPEATSTVVPDAQTVVDQPASDNVTLPIWQLVTFVVGSFLGGGAISIVGFGVLATKIMQSPAALKNAEAVGNSVPQETANKLIDLANSAISIATLAKEVLDHIPADTKTPPEGSIAG